MITKTKIFQQKIIAPYKNYTSDKNKMNNEQYIHYIEDINVDNDREWK